MAEPPGPCEHLERACVAQLSELQLDRPFEVSEVALDLLVAEQVVRERAAAVEELVGQLAEEHPDIGEAFAGLALGDCVERAHPRGREQEEVACAAAVDDERVPMASAR